MNNSITFYIKKDIFKVFLSVCFFVFTRATAQEKTAFQISNPWSAAYDIRSDVAIVYGINDAGGEFEKRVKGWRDKGYKVHFMTGIAWGQYQDYFLGKFDGKTHLGEGQVQRNGDTIWHGKNVPYIVPTSNYLTYIKTHLKRAIDAGVSAIHLEEPEFWARAGYSTGFQSEWEKHYGFSWKAQHESPEATYLSQKLKYLLYYNALKECFSYVKSYSKSIGKKVQCFVPTHSLINYSAWKIVSPEASLASINDVDGYIAQVWTGTAREPVYFNGVKKERVFENAFLEYGAMVSMIEPTGKKIFLLTDPIEDWPRSWDDYKKNYEATFTAELLYPTVDNYEVMPWPSRIYLGKFKVEGTSEEQAISPAYATQMQVMINALNRMPLSANKVNGSHGIGILLANSMMFQTFPTHEGYEDPQLSNFYGMAMPLLKRGVPVDMVHMENLFNKNALKNIDVLIMSYANMKPLSAFHHTALANWVRQGGILIYYGKDDDPFQKVTEWWNSNGNRYASPSQDLFKQLKITDTESDQFIPSGKGWVFIKRTDPKELVLIKDGDKQFIETITTAYEKKAKKGNLIFKNNFLLQRGPFVIAAVLDEWKNNVPLKIKGPVLDLFNPELPVMETKEVESGKQAFLYDLNLDKATKPHIIASAARIYAERHTRNTYSFIARSPSNTDNIMRIRLPKQPHSISASSGNKSIDIKKYDWDLRTKTLLIKFENFSEGVDVTIQWDN